MAIYITLISRLMLGWVILLRAVQDIGQIVLKGRMEIFKISRHMHRVLIATYIIINDIN